MTFPSHRPTQFHVLREIAFRRGRALPFLGTLLLVIASPPSAVSAPEGARAVRSTAPAAEVTPTSPTDTTGLIVPAAPAAPAPSQPPRRRRPGDSARIRHAVTELDSEFSFLTGQRRSSSFVSTRSTFANLPAVAASAPTSISLDTFDAGSTSGSVLTSTSWNGQVTQNASSITIAGSALNDNGWAARGLNLDASGLGFITVTAQRDTGHASASLFIQFEDRAASTNTAIFSVDAAQFAFGSPTTVSIAIGTWPSTFNSTQIGGWSIGGGGVGTTDFRMTLHNLELTASAIPEPEFYAAASALAALAFAAHRRRRRQASLAAGQPPLRR